MIKTEELTAQLSEEEEIDNLQIKKSILRRGR
jgi:hypothetical protein